MWDCQLCGQQLSEAIWCQQCNAIPFCSQKCYRRACRSHLHPVDECLRLRKQLEVEETRLTAWEGVPKALQAESCSDEDICTILKLLSIHRVRPFDALCPCPAEVCTGVDLCPLYHELGAQYAVTKWHSTDSIEYADYCAQTLHHISTEAASMLDLLTTSFEPCCRFLCNGSAAAPILEILITRTNIIL